MTPGLGRREFLLSIAAAAGAAACGSSGTPSGDEGATTATTGVTPDLASLGVTEPVFRLGVASGDPTDDSVILWTRLAPEPLLGGGMPDVDVAVDWEVATDDTFNEVVASGTAVATPAFGHAVHVDAGGLDPDTWYAYRFRVGAETSPVGRTRTFPAPDASPERLRLAVANCQDYQSGRYAAYGDLVERDLDVVLFVGDYIYEFAGVEDPDQAVAERRYVGGEPTTVEDYRNRYALHRLDPQLAAAHAAAPWIVTFDDHEVVNDYAGDDGAEAGAGADFAERRRAAYQAWYEHLPLRIPPPAGDGSLEVHRASSFGDLANLFVIETRQHADPPPCRDTSTFDVGEGCAERDDPERTALGADQAAWLLDGLAEGTATWQLVVNPVLMGGLDISAPDAPPGYFLETWDGYPEERRRLLEAIADRGVRNPVVLTGDYHAAFVNELRADPFDLDLPVVAPELLAAAISSTPFATDYTATNPQVRFFDPANGYLVCEVTPEGITADFLVVADVWDPDAEVTTAATFVVRPSVDGGAPTVAPA